MKFEFIDHNVSTTMNVFLIIANLINLFYNIPQMIKTYKRKTTKDFSTTFLLLRFLGNLIWVAYAIEINSFLMLVNNIVTVVSSMFIGYYKIKEIILDYKNNKYKLMINSHNDVDNNINNINNDNNDNYICNIVGIVDNHNYNNSIINNHNSSSDKNIDEVSLV